MSERRVQVNFDGIARPYRFLEYLTFGPALQRCRTHFLPQVRDRRRALVLGDGDGRFLQRLLTRNPHLRADAVDTSAGMLRLLRNRCGQTERLQTHQRSALSYIPAKDCDLVVAHFFLDCLIQAEVDQLITSICSKIRPDALWLISDFQIPPGVLRLPARLFVGTLYFAFRVLTGLQTMQLPDHATPLGAEGLVCIAQHHSLFGTLTSEIWCRRGAASSTITP